MAKHRVPERTDKKPRRVAAVKPELINAIAAEDNGLNIATGKSQLAELMLTIGSKKNLPTKKDKEGNEIQLLSLSTLTPKWIASGGIMESSNGKPAGAIAVNSTMRSWLTAQKKNAIRSGHNETEINTMFAKAKSVMPTVIEVDTTAIKSTLSMIKKYI